MAFDIVLSRWQYDDPHAGGCLQDGSGAKLAQARDQRCLCAAEKSKGVEGMSATMAELRRERDELAEQVLQLREALEPCERQFPATWGLTPTEALILAGMMDERGMSTNRFSHICADLRDPANNLVVHIHYIRKKTPDWVKIINIKGWGYVLDAGAKRKIKDELN